jgi:hypothetical protein
MARSTNRKNRVLRVPDLNLRNLSRIESNVSLALALGPATFRPTSSVAKLSALGDDFHPDCLLVGIRQSPNSSPRAHTALEDKDNLAHPTRFERVTFAFGGQRSTYAASQGIALL